MPIGEVYTSQLNRAVETGKLLGGKDVSPVDALTDSGAGSSSAMANPDGKNAKAGRAVRDLVNAPPKAGLNNLAVTHKTNVADAFGKEFADIREGEALVYKTSASGPAVLIARVQAERMDRTRPAARFGFATKELRPADRFVVPVEEVLRRRAA